MELRLREILKERGIEQKELAERTGLSNRHISELCTNKIKRVPRDSIAIIARELHITDANELFRL
jgi:putative transcriptional regulator